MNILFTIPSLDTGGAQSFLLKLCSHFPQTENKIYLWEIYPEKRKKVIYDSIRQSVEIITPYYGSFVNVLSKRKLFFFKKILTKANHFLNIESRLNKWQFERLIIKREIDIVNTHMYIADSFCCKILQNHKIPIVSTFHGCYNLIFERIKEGKTDIEYTAYFLEDIKHIFKRLNGIIYLTERQIKFSDEIDLKNIVKRKIYNGFLPIINRAKINIQNFDNNLMRFGMVARGDESKGWELLIQAFLLVKSRNPLVKLSLTLVGGGEYIIGLRKKYTESTIIFTGEVIDSLAYIQNFDICVLPTYFAAESLPNSIIEYLYMGKPVIATVLAEIPYMLKTEEGYLAGTLIPLNKQGKPDVEELANAIEKYILKPGLIHEQASLAKQAYKKFDIHICINKYHNFFSEIVSERNNL